MIYKNKVTIKIWNVIFQDFQLFSIANENMNCFIKFKNWRIILPQNKHKLNYWGQNNNLVNWEFEGETMQNWYRQLLKKLGENNYSAIYRLKNFFVLRENSNEINMLDDLWNSKLNKRNIVYNLLALEIMALIKDIEKFNFYIHQNKKDYDIIQCILII